LFSIGPWFTNSGPPTVILTADGEAAPLPLKAMFGTLLDYCHENDEQMFRECRLQFPTFYTDEKIEAAFEGLLSADYAFTTLPEWTKQFEYSGMKLRRLHSASHREATDFGASFTSVVDASRKWSTQSKTGKAAF